MTAEKITLLTRYFCLEQAVVQWLSNIVVRVIEAIRKIMKRGTE